jgi:hypothetical protein
MDDVSVAEAASYAALGAVTFLWAIASYEVYAVKTGRFPPITKIIKGAPWPLMVAGILIPPLLWFDHFITGWFL